MWTSRGAGVSKAEWHKVYEAAKKATSLLQPGSRATDVAATFTSFASGTRGQHGVDIYAMDLDDKHGKTYVRSATTKAQVKTRENQQTTLIIWKLPHVEKTHAFLLSHL